MPDECGGKSEEMDAPAKKAIPRRPAGLFVSIFGFLALAIFLYFGMFRYPLPFGIIDTENFAEWANTDFKYGSSAVDVSVISPTQGMGGLSQPIGVWINPAYILPRLLHVDHPRAAMYFISAMLLGLSAFVLAVSLKLPKFLAVICAQTIAIFSFPPMNKWIYAHIVALNGCHLYQSLPAFALPVTMGTLFLAVFIHLGTVSNFKNVVCVILLTAIFVYSTVADPLYTAVFWVPIGAYCAGVFFIGTSKRILLWRSAGAAFCILCAAAFHIISFYRGLIKYAARGWFPNEQYVEVQRWDYMTALIFQGKGGAIIGICILLGTILAIIFGSKSLRGYAAGVAAFAVGMILISLVYVYSGIRWSLPMPSYYETGAQPGYVVAAAAGGWIAWKRWQHRGAFLYFDRFLNSISKKPDRGVLQYVYVMLVPLLSCGGFVIAEPYLGETSEKILSQRAVGVVGYVQDQIAIGNDGRFRGSVASMLGVPGGNALKAWEDKYPPDTPYQGMMISYADTHFREFDPHLYMSGLWSLGIPTLEDNNHVVTPPYYYLMSRAFSRPQDYHPRNWNYISKVNPNLMAALGCRFLIDDRPEPDPLFTFRVQQTGSAAGATFSIYVYELANPNTGNYSPTKTIFSNDAKQTVGMMVSPQFDFQNEAIVHDQAISGLATGLVKADEGQFSFENGGVRVKARSSGRSLLVLPVQFSNSLEIIEHKGDTSSPVSLIRVNLLETGVLFQGNLEIKFAHIFGPFRRTDGRLKDIADCIRLGIKEDGSVKYPPDFQPLAWR